MLGKLPTPSFENHYFPPETLYVCKDRQVLFRAKNVKKISILSFSPRSSKINFSRGGGFLNILTPADLLLIRV